MFHRVVCRCAYGVTLVSMFEPHVFYKVCEIFVVEWRSVASTQFVGGAEVRHDLVHCWNDG